MGYTKEDFLFAGLYITDGYVYKGRIRFGMKAGDVTHIMKYFFNYYNVKERIYREDRKEIKYKEEKVYSRENFCFLKTELPHLFTLLFDVMKIPDKRRTFTHYTPDLSVIQTKEYFLYFLLGMIIGNGTGDLQRITISNHYKIHFKALEQYLKEIYDFKQGIHFSYYMENSDVVSIFSILKRGVVKLFSQFDFNSLGFTYRKMELIKKIISIPYVDTTYKLSKVDTVILENCLIKIRKGELTPAGMSKIVSINKKTAVNWFIRSLHPDETTFIDKYFKIYTRNISYKLLQQFISTYDFHPSIRASHKWLKNHNVPIAETSIYNLLMLLDKKGLIQYEYTDI